MASDAKVLDNKPPQIAEDASAGKSALRYSDAKRETLLQAIYDAAVEEFSAHGLRGASVQKIASRAGITRQHLHYYVRGKEELYNDVLARAAEGWGKSISLAGEASSPEEAIALVVRSKLDFAIDYPRESRLLTLEIMAGGEFIEKQWARWADSRRRSIEAVERWTRAGLIRQTDPMLFIFHIWALTQYYADYEVQIRKMLNIRPEEKLEREKIAQEVIALLLQGVAVPPDATG